jgi:hypothetical protein
MPTARMLALGLAVLGLASACHREPANEPRASPPSTPQASEPHAGPEPTAKAVPVITTPSPEPDVVSRERTAPVHAVTRDDAPPIAPTHADAPSRSPASPSSAEASDPGDVGGDTTICCRVCRKGKACGDTCVSQDRNCTAGPGCACNG